MNTCPCCGYQSLPRDAWDDICPVCFWQNDAVDLAAGFEAIGPNRVSLAKAQRNFQSFGAAEPRFKDLVVEPARFLKDSRWRLIEPSDKTALASEQLTPYEVSPLRYWIRRSIDA